ncbi:metallophosphoesterase family protein [Ectobacillus polymachus]|uniref:metallophosphoesterase family protein n=1 Tax=Ectobacillus polymachus TaxID=1508806 RepID=UPI003A88FE7F
MNQLSFIQLSDTHFRNNYLNDPLEEVFKGVINPAENLVAILRNIDFKEIDFIAITGDLVHDGSSEDYKYLKGLVEDNIPFGFPVFYCLGNHDDKQNYYQGFFNIQNKSDSLDYMEEVNGYRLIFLDTSVDDYHEGVITDTQLDWLEEILKEKSEAGTLLFMHHPLVWNGDKTTEVSDRLFDILKNSDIISIHSGHLHYAGINQIGKIPQFSIESLAFGVHNSKDMVNYTSRNSYNYFSLRNQEIFSHPIPVNPQEKIIWALTHEENKRHTAEHYGK